jgi:hypothetical protein
MQENAARGRPAFISRSTPSFLCTSESQINSGVTALQYSTWAGSRRASTSFQFAKRREDNQMHHFLFRQPGRDPCKSRFASVVRGKGMHCALDEVLVRVDLSFSGQNRTERVP